MWLTVLSWRDFKDEGREPLAQRFARSTWKIGFGDAATALPGGMGMSEEESEIA